MFEQKLMAIACVPLGLYLIWVAIRSFRSGETTGRSTSTVYARDEQPGWFYFYCWARFFLGLLALGAGWFYLSRLLA